MANHIVEGITLDQIAIFVCVVEEGSFSAAARALQRAQSAITYGVQNLELQTGAELFDRSSYRPTLTSAGLALLPRARRVLEAASTFRQQALNLSDGLETRLALAVDLFVPHDLIVDTLTAFRDRFPLIDVSIARQTMQATIRTLKEDQARLGIVVDPLGMNLLDGMERTICGQVRSVPVAAPHHLLSRLPGPINEEQLRDHMQVLLSTDPEAVGTDDIGAHATNRWRVNDLELRRCMIVSGLGWGGMPFHTVEADIQAGRLVVLPVDRKDASNLTPNLPISAVHLKSKPLGPAGRWLVDKLRRLYEASLH